MSRTRKHPKRRKPFNPVKTFFKVMLSIVMVFVVLAGGACFAYHKVTGEWPFGGDTIAKDADETSMLDALLGRNMKLNVAVFGVDADGTRTDVAFVVHYDSSQESLSLLSIPRDTRVDVCTDVEQLLGKRYGVMKFNAVHAIGGKEYGPQAAVLQLEDMLGIKIDHYVKVDFNALVEIVDAVGGVEVDVLDAVHVGMKAGPQLAQAGDAAVDGDRAAVGKEDAGEQFERGAFAAAVFADEADGFPLLDVERNVFEDPALVVAVPFAKEQAFFQRSISVVIDLESFGDVMDLNGFHRYSSSAKPRCSFSKTYQPTPKTRTPIASECSSVESSGAFAA